MRHGKKFNHLRRPAAHRKALLTNLAKSLVIHKRIQTTVAKAKALRKFIEPILTKTKRDTTHNRRVVFAYFQDKVPVKELFRDVAPKIADRPGGYTRIVRLGSRLGDNAEMCMIELVDYNEYLQKDKKSERVRTRRSKAKVKTIAQKVEAQDPANEKGVLESISKASEGYENLQQMEGTSPVDTEEQEANMSEVDDNNTTDVVKEG